MSQKGLSWQIILPPSLPHVTGDPERLRQILLNLVTNAVKFTDRTAVIVRAQAHDDSASVADTDTGIGIPREELPHIFEAFRQAVTRLPRRHGGAGLGLAIAQKLAELKDGQITVKSHPGDGSTFTLTVPTISPSRR